MTTVEGGRDAAFDLSAHFDEDFDVVVATGALQRVKHPATLLCDARRCLRPGGTIIAGVRNFAHWLPRSRARSDGSATSAATVLITSTYVSSHVAASNYSWPRTPSRSAVANHVIRCTASAVHRSGERAELIERVNRVGVKLYPSLFADNLLFELEPVPTAEPTTAA